MSYHDGMAKHVSILATGRVDETMAAREVLTGINAIVVAKNWLLHVMPAGEMVGPAIDDFDPDLIFLLFDDGARFINAIDRSYPVLCVAADLSASGVPSVNVDDHTAGSQAAAHLLERGYRRFGSFGFWQNAWARDRLSGFMSALGQNEIEIAGWPRNQPRWLDHWYSPHVLRSWVTALSKPAGIFVPCDAWVQMFANQCRICGVRIPEDIAIVSVDNDATVCELINPPLSSVRMPWRRIGFEAAVLGEKILHGDHPPPVCSRLAPMGVFSRRSSDMLAIEDSDVAATLSIIYAHADRPLTVAQILAQVPVSQHRLERKFKSHIGRRINQEIRRVHVARARQLLTSTELTMPEIARQSGFANASKLAIAFRAEMGRTPTEYRSRYRVNKDLS